MTCFWDSIIARIPKKELHRLGFGPKTKLDPPMLISGLKRRNRLTDTVTCNGAKLSEQQLRENQKRIQCLNPRDLDGYDCSAFDPVLMLVASIFEINIEHDYGGVTIRYEVESTGKTWYFHASTTHFDVAL